MRPASRVLLAVLVLGAALANGQDAPKSGEADPIAANLQKAKETLLAAAGKAKDKLLATFEQQDAELAKRPGLKAEDRLTLVRQLQEEKQAFAASDALPKSSAMKPGVAEYERAILLATRAFEAEYEKGANAYVAKKDTARAEAAIAERKSFLQAFAPAPGGAAPKAADGLAKGSVWEGSRVYSPGVKRDAILEITDRDGERFTGFLSIYGNGLSKDEVEGTVKGARIEWRTVKNLQGKQNRPHAGKITRDMIVAEGEPKIWVVLNLKKAKP